METKSFDVLVVGGGPGGYVCAIKAAQLGLGKVGCVDFRSNLGGTCLNEGCIPSKALLHASGIFYGVHSRHHAELGLSFESADIDLNKLQSFKDSKVKKLASGIDMLFKKNAVERLQGKAKITGRDSVSVTSPEGKVTHVKAKNIVIATGSEVSTLPSIPVDGKVVINSQKALTLKEPPKKMLVIGGGVIGLELGSIWSRLGSEVVVVEYLDRIAPLADRDVSTALQQSLTKQGLAFRLSTRVLGVTVKKNKASVTLETRAGGAEEVLDFDSVLVCVGRRPCTDGLGLESIGVSTDPKRGFIQVDDRFRVAGHSNIYAVGDVIDGPMLAHKASEDGIAVAEILAGQHAEVDYSRVPSIIYTSPEVAMIGKTEEQLRQEGISYKVGKLPFSINSRAQITLETEGFVKICTHAETDEILGAQIIHPHAGMMIAELGVSMAYQASSEDLTLVSHAHPELSEQIPEAARVTSSKPIHA